MYKKFYGFSEKPFNVTPDPDFLYLTKKHEEALANLIYGIESRKGFVVITGEIGTGKTTIIRALLRQLDENVEAALIFNPKLEIMELLREILFDLDISYDNNDDKLTLIKRLNDFSLEQVSNGKNVIIIIDEAQNLSEDVLEEVRLLTNLETEKDKLIQIFLVGQPDLAEKIDSTELIQLKQRISLRFHLTELSKSEIKGYIEHRLSVANKEHDIIFTERAIQKIYEYSYGVPRIINVICDNILIHGFSNNTKTFDKDIVDTIAKDFKLDTLKKARKNFLNLLLFLEIVTISLLLPVLYKTAAGVENIKNYFEPPKLVHTSKEESSKQPDIQSPASENEISTANIENTIVDSSILKILEKCSNDLFKPSELKITDFPMIETIVIHKEKTAELTAESNKKSNAETIELFRSGNEYYYLKPSRLKSLKYNLIIDEFKSAEKMSFLIVQNAYKQELDRILNNRFTGLLDLSALKDNKYLMQFEIVENNKTRIENVYFYIDNTAPFLKTSVSPVIARVGQKIKLFANASYDTLLINAYLGNERSPLRYDHTLKKCYGEMIVPDLLPGVHTIEFRATDFAQNHSKELIHIEIIK